MIRISDIKIRENLSDEEIFEYAIKTNKIKSQDIVKWKISKKSVDARDKNDVHFVYSIDIELKNEKKYKYRFAPIKTSEFPQPQLNRTSKYRPVIVGAGPAGLFAALTLVENGVCPIIIEQGQKVEDRKQTVEEFLSKGKLNPLSNVQFGEGGAGTFSDGKLTTAISNPYCKKVLEDFVRFGAPDEILYLSKPHLGTDKLIGIIKNMREYIISKGGEFLFNEKVTDIEVKSGKVKSVICNKKIKTDTVIFAIGHSSRETFKMLYRKGLSMQPKNFSVGVRIEHLQSEINKSQYGTKTKLNLPPAEYKLAYHDKNGRTCYSFCMCPGGEVIASSSERNTIVTNGMSNFLRDGKNANSALLVNVGPEDFKGKSPLAGIDFQKEIEKKAFELGGKNYFAPVQLVGDYLENKPSTKIGDIIPTYKPGYALTNISEIFPEFVNETLRNGIKYFDNKIEGFANPEAILTAPETRSSSPVHIYRGPTCVSNIKGIYPCGEGAGYAGGIMSAAVDGIKCAVNIIEN